MNKLQLYREGVRIAHQFCEANNVSPPHFARGSHGFGRMGGYYHPSTRHVKVDFRQCKNPAEFSYPCYVNDDTTFGVVLHELGHHFEWYSARLMHRRDWARVILRSGYHVNKYAAMMATKPEEDLAESFRLYVSNPSLLEHFCPLRYAALCQLKAIETRSWEEVLKCRN